MSQKPLSPPITPNPPSPWFPSRPPRGYRALPREGSEDYNDVELHPASDVEATPTTDSRHTRPCRSSTSRALLTFLGFLLGSTLVFGACAWLAGAFLLGISDSGAPTPNSYDYIAVTQSAGVLKVLAVGSLVVALGPCAILLLIFLRHGPLSLDSETAARARARAAMRSPALVSLVFFALCISVGMGLTMRVLMLTGR